LIIGQSSSLQDRASLAIAAIAFRLFGFYRKHPLVISSVLGIVLVMLYIGFRNGLGVADKTVWDWLDTLVLPMVLAVGANVYENIERQCEKRRAEDQRERELQVINEQARLSRCRVRGRRVPAAAGSVMGIVTLFARWVHDGSGKAV